MKKSVKILIVTLIVIVITVVLAIVSTTVVSKMHKYNVSDRIAEEMELEFNKKNIKIDKKT